MRYGHLGLENNAGAAHGPCIARLPPADVDDSVAPRVDLARSEQRLDIHLVQVRVRPSFLTCGRQCIRTPCDTVG
jgi:hypothetical protein